MSITKIRRSPGLPGWATFLYCCHRRLNDAIRDYELNLGIDVRATVGAVTAQTVNLLNHDSMNALHFAEGIQRNLLTVWVDNHSNSFPIYSSTSTGECFSHLA